MKYFEIDFGNENNFATSKQLYTLNKMKIKYKNNINKAEASKKIGDFLKNRKK